MPSATDHYASLSPTAIVVPAARQRSAIDIEKDGLRASVLARGILSPLLVTPTNELVAGQRRLTTALALGLASVPVRYVADGLLPTELRMIELEENIRRSELPWRDECRAVAELHSLWSATRANWRMLDSQNELGHDVPKWLRVARELSNPRIAQAPSFWGAYNICKRIDDRSADAILEDISHHSSSMFDALDNADETANEELGGITPATENSAEANEGSLPVNSGGANVCEHAAPPSLSRTSAPRATRTSAESVICADFAEWARSYDGPRFNFVHCDFPYGVGVSSGQWGGKHSEDEFKYEDSPDVYWDLITTLCANRERLMTPTAHLMFWLSSDITTQFQTIETFRKLAPEMIFQPRPLVWLKSDNAGIVPDPKRGPRWIVETALMASRGDRTLVRTLANAYAAPTARTLHPSAKPEPVLRHFFSMFVDSTTRMLDPTCGAGSALRAAESLGASAVLGIERSEEFCASARKALGDYRKLRELVG